MEQKTLKQKLEEDIEYCQIRFNRLTTRAEIREKRGHGESEFLKDSISYTKGRIFAYEDVREFIENDSENKSINTAKAQEILEVFEDFLESKGVKIDNDDKREAIRDGENPDGLCILYGTDYGDLLGQVEAILNE